MPALSNPRHERFAQELAKGKSASEAYVLAGYKDNRHNAAALAREEHISTRVAEIQDKGSIRAEVTLATLLEEAEAARALAMQLGQPAAAIAAVKEKGVLSGHRIEKRENTNRNLDSLSDAELMAIARGDAVAPQAGGSSLTH